MLWGAAMAAGFAAPIWMTFRQAKELGAHVRKGESGNLVVYANRITAPKPTRQRREEAEREIPFMKGYTVFNVEQIEGLPEHYYAPAEHGSTRRSGSSMRKLSLRRPARTSAMAAIRPITPSAMTHVQMPPFESFRDAESLLRDPGA